MRFPMIADYSVRPPPFPSLPSHFSFFLQISKHTLNRFVEILALDYPELTFYAVHPGVIWTPGSTELSLVAARPLKKGDELTMAYVETVPREGESAADARRRRRVELVRGWKFKCECARCLDPLEVGLTVDLQELYLTDPSDADDEDQQVIVLETIDLEPVLRDAVVTALPFQPVCRPDCEGLCADCGIRLEDAPDGHGHERVDPRWAALAALAETEQTSTPETEER